MKKRDDKNKKEKEKEPEKNIFIFFACTVQLFNCCNS